MITNTLIFFAIIFLLAGVLSVFFVEGDYADYAASIFSLSFCSIVSIVLLSVAICKLSNEPKAIEVYQGKTTLEYTIIDNIKTDSVVVYKNHIK